MAPSLFNFRELRRRSKASFRTEHSVDTASDAGGSGATATTSGSLTPPSVSSTSEPSLLLHDAAKETQSAPSSPRPPPTATPSMYRRSISGMSGLGRPPMNGGSTVPASPFAPKIANVGDNAWVCSAQSFSLLALHTFGRSQLTPGLNRCIKRRCWSTER